MEPTPIDFLYYGNSPSDFAARLFRRAQKAAPKKTTKNVTLICSLAVNNAAAFLQTPAGPAFAYGPARQYVAYNPGWMSALDFRAANSNAALSVFAHELGHHHFGHPWTYGYPREQEAEADFFSGVVLGRLKTPHTDVVACHRIHFCRIQSPTHGNSLERVWDSIQGWNTTQPKAKKISEAQVHALLATMNCEHVNLWYPPDWEHLAYQM
jgi:hypothetical protein